MVVEGQNGVSEERGGRWHAPVLECLGDFTEETQSGMPPNLSSDHFTSYS